ncbi:MAG: hypothetical protein JWN46_145 [Acidimicrobiales bacterium]|nr:hypothetical protein [Acidimicrobiales bacterium]
MAKNMTTGRRGKLTKWLAGGVAVITLGSGGYAIANASSNSSAPAAASATSAAKVIPFQAGQPGASKVVGQVPASYKAGTGTIVTGTAADKAKAAALAAYPGGTANRVVLLSDGSYNVHMIGVNWPHHVFVNSAFTVIGAE